MQPGDVVFVPAGLECRSSVVAPSFSVQAASKASRPAPEGPGPTVYALLSLRTGEQTVEASLGRYLNDLLRQSALAQETDGFLRSAITRRTRAAGCDEAQLSSAAAEFASKVSAAGLVQHYRERMRRLRAQQTADATTSAANAPSKPAGVSSSTVLRVSDGVCAHCTDGSTAAQFKRGTETLNMPIADSASYLITDLTDGAPHKVSALRCADEYEKICVCQILVFKGCLEIVQ